MTASGLHLHLISLEHIQRHFCKREEAREDVKHSYLAFVRLFTQSEADKQLAGWRLLHQLLTLHQSHWHNRGPQLTLPQWLRQTEGMGRARYLREGNENGQTGVRGAGYGKVWSNIRVVCGYIRSFLTTPVSLEQGKQSQTSQSSYLPYIVSKSLKFKTDMLLIGNSAFPLFTIEKLII